MSPPVGISGSRRLRPEGRAIIAQALEGVPFGTRLITGAAIGVDACVARLAPEYGLLVHTVVPANRRDVSPFWEERADSFELMPEGTAFRARNLRIVELSSRLLAFPLHPESDPRSQRSGSWMTVRLARAAGIPVDIYVLDLAIEDSAHAQRR